MSVSLIKTNFTGGEWSPSLWSRTELEKYGSACKKMRNFFLHPHGGASNRPGLQYIVATKDSSKQSRLQKFQFSVTQWYQLEFGDLYIRFVKDDGQIISTTAITGAANNGSGLIRITATAHGLQTANTVTITGVGGVPAANGTWVITVISANTYDLIGSTFAGTYTSGGSGTAIVEVSTPYVEADLRLLKFEQSADTIYITHPSYQRRKLTRTGHTAWTLSTITSGASIDPPVNLVCAGTGKFFVVTSVSADGVESEASAEEEGAFGNTLTWDAATGADHYKVYQVLNDTFRYMGDAGTESFDIPSSPTADADIAAPESDDPFPSVNNYPGVCAFHDQRMIWARTNTKPQTLFGTVIADFENHNVSSPVKDDDAFIYTINSNQVNEIRALVSLEDLIVFTSDSEWKMSAGGNTDTITPTSVKLKRQSQWGCSHLPPIVVGKSILFIDGSGKQFRDLLYTLEQDGYDGSDLSVLSSHLFETYGVISWSFQRYPEPIVWAVREDGVLLGMTYHREHKIWGWHQHDTDGLFEDVSSVTTQEGVSETHFIVKRTINGVTKRYIEKLHSRDFTFFEDAFFVDCGLTLDSPIAQTLTPGAGCTVVGTEDVTFTAGASTFVIGDIGREIHVRWTDDDDVLQLARAEITGYTSGTVVTATILHAFESTAVIASEGWYMSTLALSGLDHLEDKEVVAVADGNVVTGLTVTSGAIALTTPASKVHVGILYTADLVPMDFDVPTQTGTSQDRHRFISNLVLRLRNTRGCWVGADENTLYEVKGKNVDDGYEACGLITGEKEHTIKMGEDTRRATCWIKMRDPIPVTIQAIMPRLDYGQR